jgi:hypothetical protein
MLNSERDNSVFNLSGKTDVLKSSSVGVEVKYFQFGIEPTIIW